MFNLNEKNIRELSEASFIIVYEDFTKQHAMSLKNYNPDKYKAIAWSVKQYQENEPVLTNKTHLILLSNEIIKTNLANPSIKETEYTRGVYFLHEGNTVGFKLEKFDLWKDTTLISLIAPSPLDSIRRIYLFKQALRKSLFAAIDKFKKESLDDFLNGRLR